MATGRLSRREMQLLNYLTMRPNQVVPYDELLTAIWGPKHNGDTHPLRATVLRLRQKLGPKADRVVTVYGVGYALVVPQELPGREKAIS